MDWFRFYHDTISNTKLRRLPVAHRWTWVVVLTLASQSPARGLLCIEPGVPHTPEDIADAAKLPEKDVEKALDAFCTLGMLTPIAGGGYAVTGWHKRQYDSDDSTERSRRARDKRQQQRNVDATLQERPRNDAGPLHATPPKRSHSVAATPPDTDTDTEADTDTEREGEQPPSSPPAEATLPLIRPADIMAIWNAEAAPLLPGIRAMTLGREKHVMARLHGHPERDSAWWLAYVRRILAAEFCRGQNPRRWKATFDWAIRSEDVVNRVWEGQYDHGTPERSGRPEAGRSVHDHNVSVLQDFRREALAAEGGEVQ